MSDNEAIITKMKEIGEQITHVQEKNTALEKKYDGLDLQNIKENAEAAAKKFEELQELKTKVAAGEKTIDDLKKEAAMLQDLKKEQGKRFDELELALARNGGGKAGEVDPVFEGLYKGAILGYMRKGHLFDPDVLQKVAEMQVSKELLGINTKDFQNKKEVLAKDIVSGSGPEGGYFILPERSSQILTRIFETSPIRPLANIVTTTSDTVEFPIDDDEAESGWVGEVETRDDTKTPQVGILKLAIDEVYAKPKATQKMLDDPGMDLEAWLMKKVSSRIGRDENRAFVLGDGSKKPRGFLTYPNWDTPSEYQRHAVEQITSTGTAGSLDNADDYITLQNALQEEYQPSAVWGMQRATFSLAMQLKDEYGQYLLDPRILKQGTDKVLLGNPVVFFADMPTVAANALAVVYASFTDFYTIADRFGFRILRDPYTTSGFVKFYTTKRVGAGVTNFEAAKILKVKAS